MIAIEAFGLPLNAANDNQRSAMTTSKNNHVPVMMQEVLDHLVPEDGAVYVDATFGHGGYARMLLEAADCIVYGIDRDPAALKRAQDLSDEFDGRLRFIQGCFGQMDQLLSHIGIDQVDGVVFDLGVASSQLDMAERGFSFRFDGPLNMRMDGGRPNAADVVAALSGDELARIIAELGDERFARKIANKIVSARSVSAITTTKQLADLVRSVVPRSKDGIDPATRTFQALRIYVNDELGELERGLMAAENMLSPQGRLVVVSYHSLEDRIVKDFLRDRGGKASNPSRHLPNVEPIFQPSFNLLTRKSLSPTPAEVARNARASSAKFRAAERTYAPSWPVLINKPARAKKAKGK
jgi:16S rRNA (cytosine1402-N4)-methyltransferase